MLFILVDCLTDGIKYTRAVILLCALSAPFVSTCLPTPPSVSCTFSTDLEVTSVNLLPSASLSPSSLCNLFCKLI